MSVNVIENPIEEEKWEYVTKALKGKKRKKHKITLNEPMLEEEAFLKQTIQAEDESCVNTNNTN